MRPPAENLTREEALEFLRKHQPLPPDSELTQEHITTLGLAREYFVAHPDPACIPLMLNVFGEGSGFGVYQVCDDVFRQYSQEQLTPHLIEALRSRHRGIRYWAAHWAADFSSDERLVEPLIEYTRSEVDSEWDGHSYALSALAEIWREFGNQQAIEFLAQRQTVETDDMCLEVIDEVLNEAAQRHTR